MATSRALLEPNVAQERPESVEADVRVRAPAENLGEKFAVAAHVGTYPTRAGPAHCPSLRAGIRGALARTASVAAQRPSPAAKRTSRISRDPGSASPFRQLR